MPQFREQIATKAKDSTMSEIRDWLKILTYVVIGLLGLWLIDEWIYDGENLRIITREIRHLV
jgi:hypothetical protein